MPSTSSTRRRQVPHPPWLFYPDTDPDRRTTSWRNPTSLALSGIRTNAGHVWSCIRRQSARPNNPAPRSPKRRTRTRRHKSVLQGSMPGISGHDPLFSPLGTSYVLHAFYSPSGMTRVDTSPCVWHFSCFPFYYLTVWLSFAYLRSRPAALKCVFLWIRNVETRV